jgi:hypothetical protein
MLQKHDHITEMENLISAHNCSSDADHDYRYLFMVAFEIVNPACRQAFIDYLKANHREHGRGYWHAMPNAFFLKRPLSEHRPSATQIHLELKHLEHLIDPKKDRLIVMGPLLGVEIADQGLDTGDAHGFADDLGDHSTPRP